MGDFHENGTDIFWFCQALFEMFVIYYTVQLISHYTSTKHSIILS